MSKRPSWDDQRIFLAVIETGSLAGAARRLGLAHPTVRARIEALEARLGTALFTRSAQGLTPTAQAGALAAPARAMAHAAELFGRLAAAPPTEAAGVVRLSVSEFMGVEVIPPILARLRRSHPELAVELALSNRPADVLAQEVDIAVRHMAPAQGALISRRMPSIPLGFFAAHDYLARRGHPETPADLARHDVVGPDRDRGDVALAERALPGHPLSALALRTDSHPAQAAAARAGLGVAVLQTPVGEADPRLARVLPELTLAELPVFVVAHENLRAAPRIRAVFDALVQGLGGGAPPEPEPARG